MTTHTLYVSAAYAVSALVLAGLVVWIIADQRGRRREMAQLQASGARRRSERGDARK